MSSRRGRSHRRGGCTPRPHRLSRGGRGDSGAPLEAREVLHLMPHHHLQVDRANLLPVRSRTNVRTACVVALAPENAMHAVEQLSIYAFLALGPLPAVLADRRPAALLALKLLLLVHADLRV